MTTRQGGHCRPPGSGPRRGPPWVWRLRIGQGTELGPSYDAVATSDAASPRRRAVPRAAASRAATRRQAEAAASACAGRVARAPAVTIDMVAATASTTKPAVNALDPATAAARPAAAIAPA